MIAGELEATTNPPEMAVAGKDGPPGPAEYLDIVFDGPPGPVSGRFVESESPAGVGVNAGQWIDRGDGLWALRIYRGAAADSCFEANRGSPKQCTEGTEGCARMPRRWLVRLGGRDDRTRSNPGIFVEAG